MQVLSLPGLWPLSDVTTMVDGGSITRSLSTTLRRSASLKVDDLDARGGMCVRVMAGGSVLETLSVTRPRHTLSAGHVTATLDGVSLLTLADTSSYREPYNVPAGSDVLATVISILGSVGLRPAWVPDAVHLTRSDLSYAPEDGSKLDVVNDLLDGAGYLAADTDAWGHVTFHETTPLPSWAGTVLGDGDASVVEDGAEVERDWGDVANVVVAYARSADDTVLRAIAVNDDPTSPTSTVARAEHVRTVSVSDAESIDVVRAKAEETLATETARLEAVTLDHAWVPGLDIRDPVRVRVGDLDGVYEVQSMEIDLSAGLHTRSRVRRSR